jgi:RimJ/RimL family protein N-acetyltransferase
VAYPLRLARRLTLPASCAWRTGGCLELVGEHVVLRPASEGDLDFYLGLRNAREVPASRGSGEPRPETEIEFDRETDERLGRVELDPMGPGWAGISPDEIEVGCLVHPAHWNRAIATEATLLVAKDCFDRIGLDRLVALTTTDNRSSLRALEKLGMRHLGETQHERVHGTYQLFELTRTPRRH